MASVFGTRNALRGVPSFLPAKKRRHVYEKGADHRGERLQRRRGDPGGSENHDLPGGVRHERYHRPHRPEHHRGVRRAGGHPGVCGTAAGLRVPGYPARRGEDRHGVQRGHHPGHWGQAAGVPGGAHRGGSGDGGHQRLQPDAGQRPHRPDGGAVPPGGGDHPQYPRGGAAVRLCHWGRGRHAPGGGGHREHPARRGAGEGGPPVGGRRRPAVAAGAGPLVPGFPGGQPQQPRLRLHPVLRHRLLPGPGG